MRKKMVGLLIGFLLIGVNVFAAGDLIVSGNLNAAKGLFGNSVTETNSTRALNLVSSDAVLRVLRVTPDISVAAPAVELLHRTSADGSNTSYWDIFINPNYGLSLRDRTANMQRLVINTSGYVGIGTTNPGYLLDVNGPIRVQATVYYSSRELKNNIVDLKATEAMEAFEELNPVKFNYKTSPGISHIGFIAEDVPNLVAQKNRDTIDPMDIVAVLTKVVQEQNKTLEEKSQIVEKQQKTLDALAAAVAKLEAEMTRMKSKDMIVQK